MSIIRVNVLLLWLSAGAIAVAGTTTGADRRAHETVARMTLDEKIILVNGMQAIPSGGVSLPVGAIVGAGFVPGIARLNVPALFETDAGLGIGYLDGIDNPGATALPSAISMGATWNPQLVRAGGAMIGAEARARGFNVLLAGGTNLMRDPRNGRTFEYMGEDPLHSGMLAGAEIAGIQSANVISTVKHFALNDQETGRSVIDVMIGEAAARESDLLAFEIAIETGHPGSVMCSYNQVNGHYACGNDWLLTRVLKEDWHYPGWVMSDWGAVHALDYFLAGLDTISGQGIEETSKRVAGMHDAVAGERRYEARLDDAARRIVKTIYDFHLDANRPTAPPVDLLANAQVSQTISTEGMVLLRNQDSILPLSKALKRIAIIGGFASRGVLAGGGSSHVEGKGGPAVMVPTGDEGTNGVLAYQAFHRSSPLQSIRTRLPGVDVSFRNGRYLTDAATSASQADVAIVFVTQWMSEAYDVPDLSLPQGQDALIEAVTKANPHTIVVLETGGPVLMPWLEKTAAVVEAWYPGARGADALTSILVGDAYPSGRLPVTFPSDVAQLPRLTLPGSAQFDPNFGALPKPGQTLTVNYDIEGSDVGYRWFARTDQQPLFPFGYGLSYTRFESSDLTLFERGGKITARFIVRNIGQRDGADVPQLYLASIGEQKCRRLIGFQKITLLAGQSAPVTLDIDPRLLAQWRAGAWRVHAASYAMAVGESAEQLGPLSHITLAARRLDP